MMITVTTCGTQPLSEYWFQALLYYLQADPADLPHCLLLDQADADQQLELDRKAWEAWADEPIEPFLTIRYMPAIYWVREVTAAFRNPRVTAEGNAWALSRAEGLVSTEQMRFRAIPVKTYSTFRWMPLIAKVRNPSMIADLPNP